MLMVPFDMMHVWTTKTNEKYCYVCTMHGTIDSANCSLRAIYLTVYICVGYCVLFATATVCRPLVPHSSIRATWLQTFD